MEKRRSMSKLKVLKTKKAKIVVPKSNKIAFITSMAYFFTQIEQKLTINLTNFKVRSNVRARRPLALLRGLKKLIF